MPYLNAYMNLSTQKVDSLEKAEKIAKESEAIVTKVLKEAVTPDPKREHMGELFRAVNNLTNKRMDEVTFKFFPELRFSKNNPPPSDKTGPAPESKTVKSTRDGRKSK